MRHIREIITISTLCCSALCLAQEEGRNMQYRYATSEKGCGVIEIERKNDCINILRHTIDGKTVSEWELPYPVFRLDAGDMNNDGVTEVAVGVIKRTRYSPEPQKRLFIFKLYKGLHIRPLWLGSRVAATLDDFKIERDSVPARIHTYEHRNDGTPIEVQYIQRGFGIAFEKYLNK